MAAWARRTATPGVLRAMSSKSRRVMARVAMRSIAALRCRACSSVSASLPPTLSVKLRAAIPFGSCQSQSGPGEAPTAPALPPPTR